MHLWLSMKYICSLHSIDEMMIEKKSSFINFVTAHAACRCSRLLAKSWKWSPVLLNVFQNNWICFYYHFPTLSCYMVADVLTIKGDRALEYKALAWIDNELYWLRYIYKKWHWPRYIVKDLQHRKTPFTWLLLNWIPQTKNITQSKYQTSIFKACGIESTRNDLWIFVFLWSAVK